MSPKSRKNFKGRSPNVLRYIQSFGNEEDIGSLLSTNLVAGARLAAENENLACAASVPVRFKRKENSARVLAASFFALSPFFARLKLARYFPFA